MNKLLIAIVVIALFLIVYVTQYVLPNAKTYTVQVPTPITVYQYPIVDRLCFLYVQNNQVRYISCVKEGK